MSIELSKIVLVVFILKGIYKIELSILHEILKNTIQQNKIIIAMQKEKCPFIKQFELPVIIKNIGDKND